MAAPCVLLTSCCPKFKATELVRRKFKAGDLSNVFIEWIIQSKINQIFMKDAGYKKRTMFERGLHSTLGPNK